LNIKNLEVFLTLSHYLHFGRTAERHALSPSALSRLVQRLEDEAEVVLFERDNRQVKLTQAGQHYVQFAQSVLANWAEFRQNNRRSGDTLAGEVSLFCSVTASHSLLSPLLSQLRTSHPKVDVRVHTGDQALSLQRLKNENEDFVIAAKPDELPAGMLFKPLSSSELVFIAANEGAIHRQIVSQGPQILSQLPWVLAERGLSRKRLDHWFRQQHLKPQIYAQVSGHEAIASMVSLGFGVGLVPQLVLSNSPVIDKINVYSADEVSTGKSFAPFEVGVCVLKRKLALPLINTLWQSIS